MRAQPQQQQQGGQSRELRSTPHVLASQQRAPGRRQRVLRARVSSAAALKQGGGVAPRPQRCCENVAGGITSAPSHRRPSVAARAVASPPTTPSGAVVVDQTFRLPRGNAEVRVTVEQAADGAQLIRVATPLQVGRLLLHWGVEGGKDYKGGWRLPGPAARPPGTAQYKDRALQSPFKWTGSAAELVIQLGPDEASDVMNFVFKDDATNTWYDNNGSNFRVPLRADGADPSVPAWKADAVLPKDLCDKWAWVRWDGAGRPGRSDAQAAADYDTGVAEMRALLAKGRSLDELWRVAEAKWPFADYRNKVLRPTLGEAIADFPPPGQAAKPGIKEDNKQQGPPGESGPIPDDLVGVMAYVLWEKNGQPQGADFSGAARREIEARVAGGATYLQIAAELKYTPKWVTTPPPPPSSSSNGGSGGAAAATAAPAPAPAPPSQQQQKVQVGQPLGGAPARDPLRMIKPQASNSAPPQLSADGAGGRGRREKPLDFLVQRFAVDPATKWRRLYNMGGKAELLVVVRQRGGNDSGNAARPARIQVDFITDLASEVVLHWGVSKPGSKEWCLPPEEVWAEGTLVAGAAAADTPFVTCDDEECDVTIAGARVPLQRLTVSVPAAQSWVGGISAVVRSKDGTMWYKDAGGDFHIPVPTAAHPDAKAALTGPAALPNDLARAVVDAENSSAWTLMHRFNKAADLINEVLNGYYAPDVDVADATAALYVWLRYSATRKLTWQRNYNTQPRILSAAQDRLTHTIARAHKETGGEAQEWVRAMLSTVGRGGDGQAIRDEILNIMHRNHIPERKGLWMEEWHQKLHNNTTPDDVPICEAYLAYLEGNGNMGAYWRVLSDAGITRQRLESFDRPITREPDWFPGKRDALIRDFRNYLGILKAVHSGADLQASSAAAGNRVPAGARGYLGYVLGHLGSPQVLPYMQAAVEARTELHASLPGNRELLYLDLALEDTVRQAAERGVGAAGFGAAAFMAPLLQNLALSLGDNEEVCYCLKAWQELPASVRTGGRPSKDEALQAVAVVNRIRRAISDVSDAVVARIGDISRAFGEAFGVEAWARDLFAEEVVRGGPAFAVSLLITSIEPALRNAAALSAWQVISPQAATGVVEVVEGLHEVQDKVYDRPTVLLAQSVTGEEEIPEGAVAVLTPDAPDVLSHVSVRARNMRVLFATCHDPEPLAAIKAAAGKTLAFNTTAAGAVTWTEVAAGAGAASNGAGGAESGAPKPGSGLTISVPRWCGKWVVGMDEYADGVVGAKSRNLASLRGKLPPEIQLPASITLPFGCFEQALDEVKENAPIKAELAALVAQLNGRARHNNTASSTPAKGLAGVLGVLGGPKATDATTTQQPSASSADPADLLAKCRAAAMRIKVPDALRVQLAAAMRAAGIPEPEDEGRWEAALTALKGVWASKYNDRAYYSLRKVGLNFDDVRMAVLVQRVVPARYAFVIHTRNPSNNDETEVFAELVQGLGESLVSGMVAGSAVAFKASKSALDAPETLCYASKSEGMFVRDSLIFRSDSNGEDLEGYAGAGLYESITMDTTETRKVDYMEDALVQDPAFRRALFSRIVRLGADVETALGGVAQDIEGVVSPDGTTLTVVQTRPQV